MTTQEVLVTVQRSARARRKCAVVGALVALAAAAVLSACAGQPGAAAVVDGTAIPASDVNTAYTELTPYFQGASAANVLTVLIQEPTVTALAAKEGVGVSDEDAKTLLDQVAAKATPDAHPTFSAPSLAIARYSAAITKLQGLSNADAVLKELTASIAKLDVTVNPRFGTMSTAGEISAPTAPAWIVAPTSGASSGSPTPTATP